MNKLLRNLNITMLWCLVFTMSGALFGMDSVRSILASKTEDEALGVIARTSLQNLMYNYEIPGDRVSLIHGVTVLRKPKAIKALVDKGFPVDAPTQSGNTALMLAVSDYGERNRRKELRATITMLIQCGANLKKMLVSTGNNSQILCGVCKPVHFVKGPISIRDFLGKAWHLKNDSLVKSLLINGLNFKQRQADIERRDTLITDYFRRNKKMTFPQDLVKIIIAYGDHLLPEDATLLAPAKKAKSHTPRQHTAHPKHAL